MRSRRAPPRSCGESLSGAARTLPDLALIQTYKAQSAVERRFALLKDPLFLPSPVFVKKPRRILALAFIMVLCLLV
jgi:transposase